MSKIFVGNFNVRNVLKGSMFKVVCSLLFELGTHNFKTVTRTLQRWLLLQELKLSDLPISKAGNTTDTNCTNLLKGKSHHPSNHCQTVKIFNLCYRNAMRIPTRDLMRLRTKVISIFCVKALRSDEIFFFGKFSLPFSTYLAEIKQREKYKSFEVRYHCLKFMNYVGLQI